MTPAKQRCKEGDGPPSEEGHLRPSEEGCRHPDAQTEHQQETPLNSQGASEVAQFVTRLASSPSALPGQAAEDLQELLGHSLAARSRGERRHARLGLLIELVSRGGEGDYLTTTSYDEARAERAEAGEDWPASTSLIRAYGHWLAALRAATRFWFEDNSTGVNYRHPPGQALRRYDVQEIINGLITFYREHGSWPTMWEWDEYTSIRRELGRRAGKEVRLASRPVIRKAYGSFAAAVAAASAHIEVK